MAATTEYLRGYMLERYRAWKIETIAQMGGKCVKCGSIDGLQFHHRDPTSKSFTITKGWSQKADKMAVELEKCDLVCVACHKIEHQKLRP